MLKALFGLWVGTGNGVNEEDPQYDQHRRQKILAKGTEQPVFGRTLYYFLVRGKKGRYYVSREMWDRLSEGQWAHLL